MSQDKQVNDSSGVSLKSKQPCVENKIKQKKERLKGTIK